MPGRLASAARALPLDRLPVEVTHCFIGRPVTPQRTWRRAAAYNPAGLDVLQPPAPWFAAYDAACEGADWMRNHQVLPRVLGLKGRIYPNPNRNPKNIRPAAGLGLGRVRVSSG